MHVSGATHTPPCKHCCTHMGVVQFTPPHPFSQVQVPGRVQFPLFAHFEYTGKVSPGRGGRRVPLYPPSTMPIFLPEARSNVLLNSFVSLTVPVDAAQIGRVQSSPPHPGAHRQVFGFTQLPPLKHPRSTTSTHEPLPPAPSTHLPYPCTASSNMSRTGV